MTKYEFWEFLWPVLADDGRCVGIAAQDMRDADPHVPARRRGDGHRRVRAGFGKSTNSVICTGAAAARCYRAGAWYGNRR